MSCDTLPEPVQSKRDRREQAAREARRKSSSYCIRAERRPEYNSVTKLWRWTTFEGVGVEKPPSYLPPGIYQHLERTAFATSDEANRAAELAAVGYLARMRRESFDILSESRRKRHIESTLINLGYRDA